MGHTCYFLTQLFQRSAPAPYDKDVACKSEQLLRLKASTGCFISETLTFVIGRFDFYEEQPRFIYLFLDLIQEISSFASIAHALQEQGAVAMIINRMKCYYSDSEIQYAALKTVENLKANSIEGKSTFIFFSLKKMLYRFFFATINTCRELAFGSCHTFISIFKTCLHNTQKFQEFSWRHLKVSIVPPRKMNYCAYGS